MAVEHLCIEESYPHNQGFDETLFTPYNQVTSLQNQMGEGANAVIGLMEEMLPKDPYKLDDTILPTGWVQVIEGKKVSSAKNEAIHPTKPSSRLIPSVTLARSNSFRKMLKRKRLFT